MGAAIQAGLSFLPYRHVTLVFPVFFLLLLKLGKTALETAGVLPNPYMNGAIPYRTAPVFPNSKGEQDTAAGQSICAIMLAARCNHPLGILGPGYVDLAGYMDGMLDELSKSATQHGYLGHSAWLSQGDRQAANETMVFIYFENEEALHTYSHGPLHTKAMEWWNQTAAKHKYIGIMHEVFACPKQHWEGVYINYHPTGLGATSKEVEVNGQKVWMNPLVKVAGKLLYSNGRMGRPFDYKQEWAPLESALPEEEKQGRGMD